MLKYVNYDIVFQEIPGETTLAINISNCPCHCKGCHSSYLAEDIGENLGYASLMHLVKSNAGITCVSFMGGDSEPEWVATLAYKLHREYPILKIAWYSGRQELPKDFPLRFFDFIKLGPYIEEKGPLNNPNTNQRMYEYNDMYSDYTIGKGWRDITYKFWK